MSQRRVWVGGAAGVTVLLLVASYFLLIHPKMAQAADLRSQKAAAQQANNQLQLDIAQLASQNASLPAKEAELAVIQQQLPSAPNLPTLIRNLTTIASEAGVTLNSISPSAPAAAASSSGTTAAPNGLYDIPITMAVQGDFASNELFIQKIQTEMRRAFLVQNISIGTAAAATTTTGDTSNASTSSSSSAGASDLTVTLSGMVFVLQPQTALTTTTTTGTSAAPASAN